MIVMTLRQDDQTQRSRSSTEIAIGARSASPDFSVPSVLNLPAIAVLRTMPNRRSRPLHSSASHEAGYTLVELLVVVAILGLLTLIATPFVLRYLDSAKVSTARTEIANISAGLDLFKIDVGRYPTTEEGLDALMKAPAGVDNWNGPYIKKATGLKDPWGRPYLYRSPGQHGEFDIYSYGAKGEASASGDKPQVANW